MAEERYCVRLEQTSPFERYDPVPCAECGALVVHNQPEPKDIKFVCMECLVGLVY